jgi:hypothetical protein
MATWETFPDKPFRIIGPPVTSDPFDPWAMYGPAQTQKR